MTGLFVAWSDSARSPGWIEDGTGCHIWIGSRTSGGYGRAKVDGRTQMVYRVRYEREIDPIPDGMDLDHFACNNGAGGCCNPMHCRPVSPRENVLRSDGLTSRNLAKTHCLSGHPLSGDNLYVYRDRRQCKQCQKGRNREYYARRAAAQLPAAIQTTPTR